MDWSNIVTPVMSALGGGTVVALGVIKWGGKIVERIVESKLKAHEERVTLELKTELDKRLVIFNKDFLLYKELRQSLSELKLKADVLWKHPDKDALLEFSKQLKVTRSEVDANAPFINKQHLDQLKQIISRFLNYEIGKDNLISYLVDTDKRWIEQERIKDMVEANGKFREEYVKLLDEIDDSIRGYLRGNL